MINLKAPYVKSNEFSKSEYWPTWYCRSPSERDGVRLHSLNLIRSGLLGLPQRGAGVGGLGVGAVFIRRLTTRLRSPGWQAMSPTTASTGERPVVAYGHVLSLECGSPLPLEF